MTPSQSSIIPMNFSIHQTIALFPSGGALMKSKDDPLILIKSWLAFLRRKDIFIDRSRGGAVSVKERKKVHLKKLHFEADADNTASLISGEPSINQGLRRSSQNANEKLFCDTKRNLLILNKITKKSLFCGIYNAKNWQNFVFFSLVHLVFHSFIGICFNIPSNHVKRAR